MQSLPEPFLGEVIRRLSTEFDPDQIILFGSPAWGAPHEDSAPARVATAALAAMCAAPLHDGAGTVGAAEQA